MVKTLIKTKPLKVGHTEWGAKTNAGKTWYRRGVYVHPMGMCHIYMQQDYAFIETVVNGIHYTQDIKGLFTPQGITYRCNQFLKKLTAKPMTNE